MVCILTLNRIWLSDNDIQKKSGKSGICEAFFSKPKPSNTIGPRHGLSDPCMRALLSSHHELASVELVQQAGLSPTDQRQQWCLPWPPLNLSLWEQHNQPHVTTSCSVQSTLK